MQKLTASIPHQLGRAEAKRRIESGLSDVHRQYGAMLAGLRETWNGDSMDFDGAVMGQPVSGRIDVRDRDVYVEATVPELLAMAAGALRPLIERQGREMLTGPERRQP